MRGLHASPEDQLRALLREVYPTIEYRSIPESVRIDIEGNLSLGSPRAALRVLDDYIYRLGADGRRQRQSAAFRKARRAHGAQSGSLRSERPAWQRAGARGAHHSRILSALQDPRVRGQITL